MDNAFINQHNLSQSIFNAGNAGVVQNLAGRVPNIGALLNGNTSLTGALNTINTIPGVGPALNNLENNPLGALTNFSGLNLQGGLPSLVGGGGGAGSPGLANGGANPLSEAFSLASSLGASSIPSSITGAVQLALQVKTIICNLHIPNITIPDIQNLLKINFTSAEKQIQALLLHEVQEIVDEILDPIKKLLDQLATFFDPEKIKKLLASIIPDVNDLITNTVNQFTKCNNGPAAKQNDLSGKNPTGTAPTPVPDTIVPPQPTAGQSLLDSAASQGYPGEENDAAADNQVAAAATATAPTPPSPNVGTETDYDANGNVVSSKNFDVNTGNTIPSNGTAPAPGTLSIPAQSPLYDAGTLTQLNPIGTVGTGTALQAATAPITQASAPNANTVYAPAGFKYTP